MSKIRLLTLIFAFLLAALFSPLVGTPTAEAGTAASFNVSCPLSHTKPDDPIVFPGVTGASHMHNFYGNVSTAAASTEQSLLAASSDCTHGFGNTDHSAYWVPTLYQKNVSGVMQPVTPSHATIYYQGDGSAGQKIVAFPQGLRMIAGDSRALSPQPTSIVSWHCVNSSSLGTLSAAIPNCSSGQTLTATIHFPSCWDGHNLDSADHKSHMAYIQGKTCPADHPVRVPALMYSITFPTAHGNSSSLVLSSGSQYSMHADFFAAWDNRVQSALVNSCLNAGKHCNGMDRSQVNLAAATPGSPGDQVLGASTQATPQPAPGSSPTATPTAATLPDTGATLGTITGLTALGFAFFYYRKHKQAILAALRQPR